MNAFRFVFLFSVLTAAVLLLFVAQAPPVYERMHRDGMVLHAEAEARNIIAVETSSAAARALVATRIASAPALVAALSPSEPTMGPDGVPVLPRRATPDVAMAAAQEGAASNSEVNLTLVALYDTDGTVLFPTRDSGILAPDQLSTAGEVATVLASGAPTSRMATIGGRLYGVAAQPVRSADGAVVGAVALAEEYTSQLIATRRDPTGAHLTYFADREVIHGTDSDAERSEIAESLVRRLTAMDVGTRLGLRRTESAVIAPADGTPELSVLMAPVEIWSSGESLVGVLVTVDAQATPPTLLGILIEGQAFADSTVKLWLYLALGLFVFFAGLALHDWGLGRGVNRLADTISAAVTNNDPPPVPELNYPSTLRPIVRSYNAFVEAYRSHLATARRAREDAEHARHEAETALGAADSAREEVARVRAESSSFGSQPQIELPPLREAGRVGTGAPPLPSFEPVEPILMHAEPPVAAPALVPLSDFEDDDSPVNRLAASFLAERPSFTPVTPESVAEVGSLDDLADAMAEDDTRAADERRSQDAIDDLSGFEAAFNFDGPSIRGPDAVFQMVAVPSSAAVLPDPDDVTAPPPGTAPLRSPPPAPTGTQRLAAIAPNETGGTPIARIRPTAPPPLTPRVTGEHRPVSPTGEQPRVPTGEHATASGSHSAAPPSGSHSAVASSGSHGAVGYGDSATQPVPEAPSQRRSAATPSSLPSAPAPEVFESLDDLADAAESTQGSTASPTMPTPRPAAVAPKTGVVGRFAGVFDEPPVDDLLDAVDALNEQHSAGTVPRVTTAELARRAAEQAAASRAAAAATPAAPTDSILAAAEERLRRLRANTGALNAVAASSLVPGVNAPAVPAPAAPAAPAIEGDSPENRALYAEFVEARRRCNELDELPYERFVRRLEKNRAALRQQLNCLDVRFRVDVDAGKATLKATPVR